MTAAFVSAGAAAGVRHSARRVERSQCGLATANQVQLRMNSAAHGNGVADAAHAIAAPKVETVDARQVTKFPAAAPVFTPKAAEMLAAVNEGKDATQKRITLLGSTGSIGVQTLDIVRERPSMFSVVGLTGGSNVALLADQAREFRPEIVCVQNEAMYGELKQLLADLPQIKVVAGDSGVVETAAHGDAEMVVTGIVGCAGLLPTIAAIKAGKNIALANKETLIAGGPVVLPLVKEHGTLMTPADSEHSAIFQCLQGAPDRGLSKVILTASGGAFRDWPVEKLRDVTVADALKHPNWSMGAKITIDSATLMNKGLEVIEAHYLFGASYDDIEIVVHPQSIVHSMVEFSDTSVLAQLGWPDMRLPLLYAMSWPQRIAMPYDRLDLVKQGELTFRAPDRAKYPCMDLAYAAGRKGGTMPAVLNAANEAAVELFRQERIHYLQIAQVIESVMERHKSDWLTAPALEDIVHFDSLARTYARELVEAGSPALATVSAAQS
mmetsp:Transcript_995/g.2839  ORF Transcript_995/g.2839 Transcript_995/m.2839 type:complete len:495 (-) Transcript_995:87-1571(-)